MYSVVCGMGFILHEEILYYLANILSKISFLK